MSELAEAAAPAEGAENPGTEGAQAEGEATAETPQKRGESDQAYELRLSKLTREARIARSEAEKYKGAATKYEGELAQLRAKLEKTQGRKLTSGQYRDLVTKANAAWGDPAKMAELFDPDDGAAQLPKEMLDKLEAVEKRQREQDERTRRENEASETKREVAFIRDNVMRSLAESGDCPLFEVFPGYAGPILNAVYKEWHDMGSPQGVTPDPYEIATKFHKGIADDILTALKSPKTRSFLFSAVPELKALLGEQEAGTRSPQSEHQGAARGNGSPAKASPPTVSRKSEPKKKLERYEADEQRAQATLDAYHAYQRSIRGKA